MRGPEKERLVRQNEAILKEDRNAPKDTVLRKKDDLLKVLYRKTKLAIESL